MEKNNTKLNKIYKILRIILIVFVLFSAMKSCAKAMTKEDVIEYLQQSRQNYNMSVNKFSNVNKLINSTTFNTYITDEYLEDFSQCIIKAWDSGSITLYFFDSTTPTFQLISINTSPPTNEKVWRVNSNFSPISYYSFTYNSTSDIYEYGSSGSSYILGTNNNNFTQTTTSMFYSGTINANGNTWIGYNIYNYIKPHDITFDSNTYAADVRVGEYYNINNITYKLYMVQDNIETEIPFNYTINYQNGIYGKVGLFNITNLGVLNNANCRIKMFNNTNLLYTSDLFNITSSGNQGNISGEQGGNGNINLTETNNLITNLTSVVESGNNKIIAAIESGEKKAEERDNFWKETYNALFTLNSGDIAELQTKISGELAKLTSGDSNFAEEKEILDMIYATEPGDLKIEWGSVTYLDTTIIPSGDINFNAIVREWGLEDLLTTLQVIMTASLVFIIYKAIWKCICIMLGIGTEMYEDMEEENRTIAHQTDTFDTSTGIHTTINSARNRKQTTNIITKRRFTK